jgi:HTH-type transcriptional regulator/antitoxin HigA|tara:strand:- start:605 stop:895 length:291 start_codon:yes stop_codon:yes gene_type:complete
MTERTVAETFPPGEFIADELTERGWTTADLAARMGGDPAVNQLDIDLLIHAPSRDMILAEETAQGLARAFGVSASFFLSLDRAWRDHEPPLELERG